MMFRAFYEPIGNVPGFTVKNTSLVKIFQEIIAPVFFRQYTPQRLVIMENFVIVSPWTSAPGLNGVNISPVRMKTIRHGYSDVAIGREKLLRNRKEHSEPVFGPVLDHMFCHDSFDDP